MAFEVPPAAIRLRRTPANYRRADDAAPPRQAPPGLRRQCEQGARGHAARRRTVGRADPDQPRHAPRRQRGPPRATTSAATQTTRSSGRSWRRTAAAPRRRARPRPSPTAFGRLRRAEGGSERRRREALRLRLDVARPRRHRARRDLDAEPGLADLGRAARRSSASTSGSTPTTSITRTGGPTTWRPGGTSSTGTRCSAVRGSQVRADRKAEVVWKGDLMSGSGTIVSSGSGALSNLDANWKARTESSDGSTSPEELIAAAHASCFSMALSHGLAQAGSPAEQLDVSAVVSFEQVEGGWKITKSALDVSGTVPGWTRRRSRRRRRRRRPAAPSPARWRGTSTSRWTERLA